MPRLSRKKEKSKIIKKKNTKKITTKKNLKGGGEFGGSRLQKPNIQQKLSRKQINNIQKHNFVFFLKYLREQDSSKCKQGVKFPQNYLASWLV